jgi:hypothetical protein
MPETWNNVKLLAFHIKTKNNQNNIIAIASK